MNTRRGPAKFVLCIRNDGYPEALDVRKLYQVITDAKAAKVGYIRLVDESGEDYLYPNDFFADVKLAPSITRVMGALSLSSV